MGSGKAKKARKAVFQNGKDPSSLPPMQQQYINKEIDKMINQLKITTGNQKSVATFRAFPCQKLKNKFAYIPYDAKPELKDDGLWYIGDELIISDDYRFLEYYKERQAEEKANRIAKETQIKNIKEMKPTVLGEDGN